MNNKYIIGNWKMNPESRGDALNLAQSIDEGVNNAKSFVGIAPPFLFLPDLNGETSNIYLGAQDSFWEKDTGAFTGEVSPSQLKEFGVEFVILGHSERRMYLSESDEEILKKIKAAFSAGLKVVLCVGESAEERNEGEERAKEFVKNQLDKNIPSDLGDIVVAYEPLWSISTFEGSKPAEPKVVQNMTDFIKSYISDRFSLDIPVLYGGSTDSKNLSSFISINSVDGVLVGGSSLDSSEFIRMINILKGKN